MKLVSELITDYRWNGRYIGPMAVSKGKPLEVERYTGGSDRYTGGAQLCDENTLESDQTTGVSQMCLFLMCWHDFWPLD